MQPLSDLHCTPVASTVQEADEDLLRDEGKRCSRVRIRPSAATAPPSFFPQQVLISSLDGGCHWRAVEIQKGLHSVALPLWIQTNQYGTTMVLDSLSSPHRRSQNTFFVPSAKKPQTSRDDSWSALVERHRFLLTTLVVLAFLCTIYLYFAVTLGASNACAGLAGAERIECQAKSVLRQGKLKFP
ncbi:hypothetical protein U9M48_030041 [Paspalum notatum var. saurae]|uniref:Uncharacterized protein n=1 Tax=Paspalum notatum var. saurae TaxID=547442 RepID=A0AAQ3X3C4_PASNO